MLQSHLVGGHSSNVQVELLPGSRLASFKPLAIIHKNFLPWPLTALAIPKQENEAFSQEIRIGMGRICSGQEFEVMTSVGVLIER